MNWADLYSLAEEAASEREGIMNAGACSLGWGFFVSLAQGFCRCSRTNSIPLSREDFAGLTA